MAKKPETFAACYSCARSCCNNLDIPLPLFDSEKNVFAEAKKRGTHIVKFKGLPALEVQKCICTARAKDENKCLLHPNKPLICKAFPFGVLPYWHGERLSLSLFCPEVKKFVRGFAGKKSNGNSLPDQLQIPLAELLKIPFFKESYAHAIEYLKAREKETGRSTGDLQNQGRVFVYVPEKFAKNAFLK